MCMTVIRRKEEARPGHAETSGQSHYGGGGRTSTNDLFCRGPAISFIPSVLLAQMKGVCGCQKSKSIGERGSCGGHRSFFQTVCRKETSAMKAVQFLEIQQKSHRLRYFYSSSKASFPFTILIKTQQAIVFIMC